jgi:hypothetical protein
MIVSQRGHSALQLGDPEGTAREVWGRYVSELKMEDQLADWSRFVEQEE